MENDYYQGLLEQQTRERTQLVREYMAIAGKIAVLNAEMEHTKVMLNLGGVAINE